MTLTIKPEKKNTHLSWGLKKMILPPPLSLILVTKYSKFLTNSFYQSLTIVSKKSIRIYKKKNFWKEHIIKYVAKVDF